MQKIAHDRSHVHHVAVLPSKKPLVGKLVQKREEWIEEPS
jgi:hypothetical protein